MNPLWLLDVTGSNTGVLWIVGTLATVCVVVISRPLRRVPQWRAAVVGIAAILFVSPVHSVAFDPWWRAPWPSVYITAALAVGAFDAAGQFFKRDFILPPIAWGVLAGVAWYRGYDAISRARAR